MNPVKKARTSWIRLMNEYCADKDKKAKKEKKPKDAPKKERLASFGVRG